MSNFSRLPSLIINTIQSDWECEAPSFTPEPDTKIPFLLNQENPQPPFRANLEDSLLHDHSYVIRAKTFKAFPSRCSLLVTEWSLSYNKEEPFVSAFITRPSCFTLLVLSAEVIPDISAFKSTALVPIDYNPAVFFWVKRFRFNKLRKEFEKFEENSQKTENSELFVNRLENIVDKLERNVGIKIEESRKSFELSLVEENQDDYFESKKSSQNKEKKNPGLEKLELFKQTEEIIEREKDENSLFNLKREYQKTDTSHSEPQVINFFTPQLQKVKIKENLTIERFSEHALEILKQKFGVF
jgi:hypothetical protein